MVRPDEPAPATLAAVCDPAWLGRALAPGLPDARVSGVAVVETLVTQATKVRLALEWRGADASAPRHVCVKGVLVDTGAPPAASIVETRFYRDLAGGLGVRVPPCVYASLDDAGSRGVIVMRDVIEGGATFLSALTPFTPAQARAGLEQLAILHARTPRGGAAFEDPGFPSFLDQITARPIVPRETLQLLLDGERGAPLPRAVRDASRLQSAVERLAAAIRPDASSLVHGDAHAGNCFEDADGIGLVDWQILQKGSWAQDVAYHLAAVLSPEDRRRHERALLAHYLDRLARLGGPAIDPAEAWDRYRAAMIYGFYLWAVTRKVEPVLIHEFVRRLGLAVDELGSFERVGA